jgi:hypothetical protein
MKQVAWAILQGVVATAVVGMGTLMILAAESSG